MCRKNTQINLLYAKSELFYFFIIHINQHLPNIPNHMTMTVWTLFTETMFSGETPLTLVSGRIVMQQMEKRGKTIYSTFLHISHQIYHIEISLFILHKDSVEIHPFINIYRVIHSRYSLSCNQGAPSGHFIL